MTQEIALPDDKEAVVIQNVIDLRPVFEDFFQIADEDVKEELEEHKQTVDLLNDENEKLNNKVRKITLSDSTNLKNST